MNFEQYLNDFNSTINIWQFIVNIIVVTIIAYILKLFYTNYGTAISNRAKFSNNFVPLALGTLLIITVIGSSVALSLGLVGALSIVRFRAAIKDPEELIYLFLVIGVGLTGGANKPLLAIVSFAILLPLLYLNSMANKKSKAISHRATLHIKIGNTSIVDLNKTLEPGMNYLKLKRADYKDKTLNASYECVFENGDSLEKIRESLSNKDPHMLLTYIDQPDLLL